MSDERRNSELNHEPNRPRYTQTAGGGATRGRTDTAAYCLRPQRGHFEGIMHLAAYVFFLDLVRGQLQSRGRLGVASRHRQHESRVASTICRVHVEPGAAVAAP